MFEMALRRMMKGYRQGFSKNTYFDSQGVLYFIDLTVNKHGFLAGTVKRV